MSDVPVSDLEWADKILDLVESKAEVPEFEPSVNYSAPEEWTREDMRDELLEHLEIDDSDADYEEPKLLSAACDFFADRWREMVREQERQVEEIEADFPAGEVELGGREIRLGVEAIVREIRVAERSAA